MLADAAASSACRTRRDADTREEVLDEVLDRDPFRLDGVARDDARLERDQPCDGLLDEWIWSHRVAFFDG